VTTPAATFPEIVDALLFQFVALSFPDIIGVLKNLGRPWICPRFLFSKFFNGLLFGWTLCMYRPNLKSVALPDPEIIVAELAV